MIKSANSFRPLSTVVVLQSELKERVWGGQRLKKSSPPIGEAWVVHEDNRVLGGAYNGQTLKELAKAQGSAFLGSAVNESEFPLLIKLIDAGEALSVQVHPNDEQAVQLEGAGHRGKTEAWHVLEADPGATLISGIRSGVTSDQWQGALGTPAVKQFLQEASVSANDTLSIPAGTVHAIGRQMMIYEVQQSSDITYRVYDWDRPASEGRKLHLEQARLVSDLSLRSVPSSVPQGGSGNLVRTPYFSLDRVALEQEKIELDTQAESFHALTVTEGSAVVVGEGFSHAMTKFDTVVVPASVGRYAIEANESACVLKASVV